MSESLTISIAAACRRYQIERDELYKLMESGHAPFVKLGRRILILAPFADAYFAKLEPEPVTEDRQLSFAL